MRKHDTDTVVMEDGSIVEAQAPVIVSASRSTDLPAFYADWFFERLRKGYSIWKNPFSGKSLCVSYRKTRFIVFWSKNPRPLLARIDELKDRGIGCYVQFSLNDYVREGLEPNVPSVEQRIDTFARLSGKLGRDGVIWRNDPLLLTDTIGVDELLRKAERMGGALAGLTEKLVFSFADITFVAARNLRRAGVRWREWTPELMREFAAGLAGMASGWGIDLATCAEEIDLEAFGVRHNRCIDDRLIVRRAWRDAELMRHLGAVVVDESARGSLCPVARPKGAIDLGGGRYAVLNADNGDKGQRTHCGCVKSKDIGEYSTCRHFCAYCYANAGDKEVLRRCAFHAENPHAASITGCLEPAGR